MVRRFLIGFAFAIASGCASTPPAEPPSAPLEVPKLAVTTPPPKPRPAERLDRQATPEDTRDYAIELLERERYEELVEKLVRPADLEKFKHKEGGVAHVVEEFAKSEKPRTLLEILKSVKDITPELTEEGRVARFTVNGKSDKIELERIEGRWYIRN